MDFCLQQGEDLAEGMRRLVKGQLEEAISHLESGEGDGEEHVHEARKSLKRVRALLCLRRAELGDETFRRENRAIREAARQLSGMRDAAALVESLEALSAWSGEGFGRARAWLVSRKSGSAGNRETAREVVGVLRRAGIRAEGWPLQGQEWSAIGPGVRWVYARGRRAMRQALEERRDELLHEWRKYAKYLWYHSQILQGIWPPVMGAVEKELDRLGEVLGADHDLALLSGVLREELPGNRARKERDVLGELIPRRRAELQEEAQRLGQRLYAEKPGIFARRWGGYWAGWREEGGQRIGSPGEQGT